MATNIAMTQSVQAFLPAKRQMTEDSRYLVFNVINNIQPYRNSNRFVKDFYIYFKNSDIIINSNMCSPEFIIIICITIMISHLNNGIVAFYKEHTKPALFLRWKSLALIPSKNDDIYATNTITEKINPSAILFMLVERNSKYDK